MANAGLMSGLGLDPDRRAVIVHADDVGMCHGANESFIGLARAGALTCGSVMVPCPWFAEIAHLSADDPSLDLGVHLTLTSEWSGYRWAPLTRAPRSSGLVDDEGYFPRNVALLADRVEPEAAEAEIRAQIDRALAFGVDVTHLDTHMGAALSRDLVDVYCRVGRDYALPVLVPREPAHYANVLSLGDALDRLRGAASTLEAEGMPLVDHFRMTPGVPSQESEAAYRNLIESLPEGITFLALHPNISGDIETIVPPRAHYRTDEHRLLADGSIARWIEEAEVQLLGMRAMRDLYRAAGST